MLLFYRREYFTLRKECMKIIYITLGFISIGLGIVGIFLPALLIQHNDSFSDFSAKKQLYKIYTYPDCDI